jgi:hypothetical protein
VAAAAGPDRDSVLVQDKRLMVPERGEIRLGKSNMNGTESRRYLDDRRNKRKLALVRVALPCYTQLNAKAKRDSTVSMGCGRFVEEQEGTLNHTSKMNSSLSEWD